MKQLWISPNAGNWRKIKNPDNLKASAICKTKIETIKKAIPMAKKLWAEMFVQNLNWKIGYKNSYWNDPHNIPG